MVVRAGALLGRLEARLRNGVASGLGKTRRLANPRKEPHRTIASGDLPDFPGMDVPVFFITERGTVTGGTSLPTKVNVSSRKRREIC